MNRKSFLKKLIGLTGLAIIAPAVLSKPNCPLCQDTGEVVVARRGYVGGLKFPDKTGPCPNCFPKINILAGETSEREFKWIDKADWDFQKNWERERIITSSRRKGRSYVSRYINSISK